MRNIPFDASNKKDMIVYYSEKLEQALATPCCCHERNEK